MENRNQYLLLDEKQSSLGMYLFGLSILGELSDNFTKKSNFVEDTVENQGEIMKCDMNDTQKRIGLKSSICKSDKNDLLKDKKNEITTIVGLMSVFN